MDLLNYLKLNNIQKQIDDIAKRYKNSKIVLYGAGEYFKLIEKNYDLSALNIVGISDKKFERDKNLNETKYTPLAPEELKEFDFDILIISLINDLYVLNIIENELLKNTKNEKKPVLPLITPTLSYLLKLYFNKVEGD